MQVWRIAKRQHAAFDGLGATTYGDGIRLEPEWYIPPRAWH